MYSAGRIASLRPFREVSRRPEDRARERIDENLEAAGWRVQDLEELDLSAGPGIAVREFPMQSGFGRADYLLYVDQEVVGAIEAKPTGSLSGVEAQSQKYAAGLPDDLPAGRRPLPFLFESNGEVTWFTNGLDPKPRARKLFNLPRPSTLRGLAASSEQLRARLQALPALDETRLWSAQARAIRSLESSLALAKPRALVQMATGSGKTFAAVNTAYRLIKHADVKRILFLVDRRNLGKQTKKEFDNFALPDDSRKFPDLYTVQHLTANAINPAAKVVVTTIQRLYAMLRGDDEYDPENEDASGFDAAPEWAGEPPEIQYNPDLPPEFFDFVIVDECHRSIYDRWSQVLLYLDAFLVGLTATPSGKTIGFFNQNLVMEYGHDEAVTDGVNVDFDVYRIRTRVTEEGATIETDPSGIYVERRDRGTRAERLELLRDDLTYTANQLDRDVVSESQIRTVVREFHAKVLPEAFPGRNEPPKTLIYAKDDSHAEDIVRIVREEFGEGNDFCRKITYRTGFTQVPVRNDDGSESGATQWKRTSQMTPEEILTNFRTSYYPRIAVTVDMIATGTDVKPIECVFFMRNVRSAAYFEQMKGRGVRVISPDKLRTVTPSARAKDRFIIVDAVGVAERDKSDSRSLNRQPTKSLKQLLDHVAQGGVHPDALTTLAGRLARLERQFTPDQLAELRSLGDDTSLGELARGLLDAYDADVRTEAAMLQFGVASPDAKQVEAAGVRLARSAAKPFLNPRFRRRILEIQQANEQTMDRHTIDEVLHSGFDAAAVAKARDVTRAFGDWIVEHRDELTALQVLYAGARPLRLSLKELRELRDAIRRAGFAADPAALWRAYEATAADAEQVRRGGGKPLADLVSLVRHALRPDRPLVPYREEVMERYSEWLAQHDADTGLTSEQREWLDRMAEHIANSLAITRDDFEIGWFGQRGSLGRAHALFGTDLDALLDELSRALAA